MTVWVAGRTKDEEAGSWALLGVFSSDETAAAACCAEGERHKTDLVWYGPLEIDVPAPLDDVDLPAASWPLIESDKREDANG